MAETRFLKLLNDFPILDNAGFCSAGGGVKNTLICQLINLIGWGVVNIIDGGMVDAYHKDGVCKDTGFRMLSR